MIDIYNKYVENPSVSLFGYPEDLTSLFYIAWKCLGAPQDAGPIGERLFTDETLLKDRSLDKVRFIALSIMTCRDLSEELRSKLEPWLEAASPGENRVEAVRRFVNYLRDPAEELDLFNLDLTSLPDIFDHPGFEGLTYLRISENKLAFLPETIGNLSRLETLSAEGNLLTEIPESLGRCRELQYLLLRDNWLTSMPDGVMALIPGMALVGLECNRFTSLPPEVFNKAGCHGNPIPVLVLRAMMRGLCEIKTHPRVAFKYFNAFHKVNFDVLCARKLFHSVWIDAGSSHADLQFGEKAFLEQGGLSMSNAKRIELLERVLIPYVRENPAIFNMPMNELEKIMPLTTWFPSLKIIGKEVWEKCLADRGGLEAAGLSINEAIFPGHEKILPILRQMSTHATEENLGLTLLVLPKGLTSKQLYTLFADRFTTMNPCVLKERGDDEIDRTRFIVMTNSIFKGSRNKTAAEQSALAQEKGCTMPGFLSVLALLLLTEKSSEPPLRLLESGRGLLSYTGMYTRCAETVEETVHDYRQVVVGGFWPWGLTVSYSNNALDSVGLVGAAEVL